MNIEINFLEKQPHKYTAPIVISAVFVLLLAVTLTILIVQKNNYTNQIDAKKTELQQLETFIVEHRDETATEQKLMEIQQAITSVQAERFPNVALYKKILNLLASPDQLTTYEFTGENQLVVEAQFKTLNDVADYVATLLEQTFITDAELTSITGIGSAYQASLTIAIDSELLVKELGHSA